MIAAAMTGGIPGALNIPIDELRDRLDELPDGPLWPTARSASAAIWHRGFSCRPAARRSISTVATPRASRPVPYWNTFYEARHPVSFWGYRDENTFQCRGDFRQVRKGVT